jgi:hypothetical protein
MELEKPQVNSCTARDAHLEGGTDLLYNSECIQCQNNEDFLRVGQIFEHHLKFT